MFRLLLKISVVFQVLVSYTLKFLTYFFVQASSLLLSESQKEANCCSTFRPLTTPLPAHEKDEFHRLLFFAVRNQSVPGDVPASS